MKYRIIRMFENYPQRVISEGLTLEQAEAHCKDPEATSSTARGTAASLRTQKYGPWYDTYEPEGLPLAQELTARAINRAQARIHELGFTKAGFARYLELPESTVLGWFNRQVISITTLTTIADAVGINPAVLIMSPQEVETLRSAARLLDEMEGPLTGAHGHAEMIRTMLEGTNVG